MGKRQKLTYGYPEPEPIPGKRFIEVGDGHFVIVDESDYAQLQIYTWSLDDKGQPRTNLPNADGGWKHVSMKNMILDIYPYLPKGECIKYLDGDCFNNSRSNLKRMTLKQARELDRKILGPLIRKKREDKKHIRNILDFGPSQKKKKFKFSVM